MRKKILIVDDDADMRRVVRAIVEPLGDILEAENGKDGLRLIAEQKPAVLLLDVAMPDLGGFAVLKAARFLDPALPIVMLTGAAGVEDAARALDDGARAYFTKPFDPELLREEIMRLVAAPVPASGGRPWRVQR